MRVIKTMRPGDRGTHRFQRHYGERLCAVRYRASNCGKKTLTTVELIVDEREAVPAGFSHNAVHVQRRAEVVALRIKFEEFELREQVKSAGGRWSKAGRAWLVRRDAAISLGLGHRVVEGLIEKCVDVDTSFEV